jgi:ribosomal protein S18 acetylase RimI-like enzyme
MVDTIIRPVEVDDLGTVAILDRQVFGKHSYSFLCLRQMMDIGHLLLAAEDCSGEIIGYTVGAIEMGNKRGWILALAVQNANRRQGIATKLTNYIIEMLDDLGATSIVLTVDPDNRAAINLYRKMGFCKVGEESDYFGPGEARMTMKKEL